MILNRFYLLGLVSLIAFSGPAFAQAVEAVPLSQPSYTLNKETDPMAMDPGHPSVTPEKSVNRGTAEIAPPPPGADDQSGTSGYDASPAAPLATSGTPGTSGTSAPSYTGNTAMDSERTQEAYPNNTVSGVVPSDEKKFDNRLFCTVKVSFTSIGTGIDSKTADRVKSYLDSNADALSYKRVDWGNEGEYDFCIDIPAHNQRAKIYTGLKRLLPSKDTGDQRTILSGTGFTRVQNSM
jgi:hypothetical protein